MEYEFSVDTNKKFSVLKINATVSGYVERSKIKNGICLVYAKHATAAIIINENYDPNIGTDFLNAINKAIPLHDDYLHDRIDNNAAAHIKAAIIGPSETIPITKGKLNMGTWQDICLVDFDGPKKRTIMVKIIGE